MSTGQINDDKHNKGKVNLREDEEVRDLDDLLADAEYKVSLSEQEDKNQNNKKSA